MIQSVSPTPPSCNNPPAEPPKPATDFPLWKHPSGRWCKKVRGKAHYFGSVLTDPDGKAALKKWNHQKRDLLAGREPADTGHPTPDTRGRRRHKKPHSDFPLFPHQTNRWAKKVRGKLLYFGSVTADPDGQKALTLWLEQRDDLLAGRKPRAPGEGLTLKDAANRYLTARRHLVDTHEITFRHWDESFKSLDLMLAEFGRNRLVLDLRPEDFTQLRGSIARGRGIDSMGNHVQRIRSFFKWLWDSDLIDRPVKFGQEFKRANKAAYRRARAAKPKRIFTAEQIRKLLEIATEPMRAMIYLGINAGFGNSDCAALPIATLDLDKGTVDFPRPKTGVERRATLWPETVAALKVVLEKRHTPKDEPHAGLAFITKYGQPWVKYREKGNVNAVSLEFNKLLTRLAIKQEWVGFYGLRHVFETIAGESGDQAAVDRIMGHADPSMAGIYREWLRDDREDARLRRVTDHVHAWLFSGEAVDKPTEQR
ncbi:MAG: tyrosine-type recombinase/integrase [Phycisphaerae bacterium]|nr:tyrosine-type recombinase/integrase [Phycisphaerae bacterium]